MQEMKKNVTTAALYKEKFGIENGQGFNAAIDSRG